MDAIITILVEIATSLRLFRPLEIASLIVCICLLSSPGAAATIVAVCGKIGTMLHLKEEFSEAEETN